MPRSLVSLAVAASAAALVAAGPAGVSAAAAHHRPAVHASSSYNKSFVNDVQRGRAAHHLRSYSTNAHLKKIALAWARHLARTGDLEHNPNLLAKVSKVCPLWLTAGENVGTAETGHAKALYEAYMHSPEHRANILDHGYRQVGIATVSTTRNGVTSYWNVMDFGAGCPK